MKMITKNTLLLIISLASTLIVLRVSLYISPNSNFDIGPYNIHHLFSGILLLFVAVVPLILLAPNARYYSTFVVFFGIGLSMVLDEWVYLIATDGSDASYLLPVSLWGAIIVVTLSILYILIIYFLNKNKAVN